MGSGKSTWAINYINGLHDDERVIVVLPYLDEIQRYKQACPNKKLVEPSYSSGTKYEHFKRLIDEGQSIVTTHQLFSSITDELSDAIKEKNYILIIDEALSCIEQFSVSKDDMFILKTLNLLVVKENKQVIWNEPESQEYEEYKDGLLKPLKKAAINKNLYMLNKNKYIVALHSYMFECFKDVYILTYLWDGCYQRYYFQAEDIPYEKYSLFNGEIVPYDVKYSVETIKRAKELINIIEKPINDIGEKDGRCEPFTKNWYIKTKKEDESRPDEEKVLLEVKRKTETAYKKYMHNDKSERMYTTFKDFVPYVSGKGYTGSANNICFVPCNAKGTNNFAHKSDLAYLINRYPDPLIIRFLKAKGADYMDQDVFALYEMLQWIWRSRIRNGGTINIYVPSSRMRRLLKEWLDLKYDK